MAVSRIAKLRSLMRHVIGRGTPRGLQGRRRPRFMVWLTVSMLLVELRARLVSCIASTSRELCLATGSHPSPSPQRAHRNDFHHGLLGVSGVVGSVTKPLDGLDTQGIEKADDSHRPPSRYARP